MRVNLLKVKMGEAEVEGDLPTFSLFSSPWWTLGIIKNLGNMA